MTASTRELLNTLALYRARALPYTEEIMEQMVQEGMTKLTAQVPRVDQSDFLDEVNEFLEEFEKRTFPDSYDKKAS